MTHETMQDAVWRLQDQELLPAQRAEALRHLAGCRECADIARRGGLLHQLLASAPQPAASDAFVASVMHRLPAPAEAVASRAAWPSSQWWGLIRRLGLSVAAAGLAMAVLIRQPPAIATEALLRAGWPEQEGWAFSNTSPEVDLLLGSTAELE